MENQERINENSNAENKWTLATQGEWVKIKEDEEIVLEVSQPDLKLETKEYEGKPKEMWTLNLMVHSVNGKVTGQNKFSTSSRQLMEKLEKYIRPLEGKNTKVKIAIAKTGNSAGTKYFVRLVD